MGRGFTGGEGGGSAGLLGRGEEFFYRGVERGCQGDGDRDAGVRSTRLDPGNVALRLSDSFRERVLTHPEFLPPGPQPGFMLHGVNTSAENTSCQAR